MLTTTVLGLKKPQTSDQKTALRTSIGDNADILETLLGARGKSVIATEETRANTSYGLMTTPDQVTVTLPTDGLLQIAYQAMIKTSVGGSNQAAAIFLGSNQLKLAPPSSVPIIADVGTQVATANTYKALHSIATGLRTEDTGGTATAYGPDVTTGQIVGSSGGGGSVLVFAAAGTYAVSVQFKAQSGSTTVKNRSLWVRVLNFG